jgi:hypothetical protein
VKKEPPSWRETVAAAASGAAVAALMTWPLSIHLPRMFEHDPVDAPFFAWEIGWLGHALRHGLNPYTTNAFWPVHDNLVFSDAMLGYAPIAALVPEGPRASLVLTNLLILFAYAFAFFGAYLLARELGVRAPGAAIAGAAFAFAPFRLAQVTHLHVLSSGGIPLSLFLLLRGYRRRRARLVVGGWLVVLWQVTLGFTLSLQLVYLLAAFGVVAAVAWWRRGRPPLPRPLVVATVAGATLVVAAGIVEAQPVERVANSYPGARRSPFEISSLSPVPASFLAAPRESLVWKHVTARFRRHLRALGEQILFPGVVAPLLALVGLAWRGRFRRVRIVIALATLSAAALSLGFHTSLGALSYLFPYRWLYEVAPGWQGVRTPGRVWTLVTLGIALLAAIGVERLWAASRPRLRPVVVAAALAGVLLDGAGWKLVHAPNVPAGQLHLGGPQFHLPTSQQDPLYQYWSTAGFPRIVNGDVGFVIPALERLRRLATEFPDGRSVRAFRAAGIRYVVFHPDLAAGTAWPNTAARPTAGLGIARRTGGGVIVYTLRP